LNFASNHENFFKSPNYAARLPAILS